MDNIEVIGIDAVQRNLNSMFEQIEDLIPRALTDVGLDLLGKAKLLAPIDTGDLRGTGAMNIESNKTAVIGFTEPYALRQHESMEFHHPLGGQAKYLEQPFKENLQRYVQHIRDGIGGVTR